MIHGHTTGRLIVGNQCFFTINDLNYVDLLGPEVYNMLGKSTLPAGALGHC